MVVESVACLPYLNVRPITLLAALSILSGSSSEHLIYGISSLLTFIGIIVENLFIPKPMKSPHGIFFNLTLAYYSACASKFY